MKRFLALMLVFTMLFTMVPAAFSDENTEPTPPPSQEQQEPEKEEPPQQETKNESRQGGDESTSGNEGGGNSAASSGGDNPGTQPTDEPGTQPTDEPGTQPTDEPGTQPTDEPGTQPTDEPGTQPTDEPGTQPTDEPGTQPTDEPGTQPTDNPGTQPTDEPGTQPTDEPGTQPTGEPTSEPTDEPTSEPTGEPTSEPTDEPGTQPTDVPTSEPTDAPTTEPTGEPTSEPTDEPGTQPTDVPTSEPTDAPTSEPTGEPTTEPTTEPTGEPTIPESVQNVQALIDALPDASVLSGMAQEEALELYNRTQSVYSAYEALRPEEQAMVNTGKLEALFDAFNSYVAPISEYNIKVIPNKGLTYNGQPQQLLEGIKLTSVSPLPLNLCCIVDVLDPKNKFSSAQCIIGEMNSIINEITGIAAGDYSVTARLFDPSNPGATLADYSCTVTIAQAELYVVLPEPNGRSVVYNAEKKTHEDFLNVNVGQINNKEDNDILEFVYSFNNPPIDAGNYELTVRVDGEAIGNYKPHPETPVFEKTYNVYINKAPLTVTWPALKASSLEYKPGLKASDFLNEGQILGKQGTDIVEFVYSFNNPPIDAGNYVLTVRVDGEAIGNYKPADGSDEFKRTYNVTIAKGELMLEPQIRTNIYYTGAYISPETFVIGMETDAEITLPEFNPAHYEISYVGDNAPAPGEPTMPGNYQIKVQASESHPLRNNYNLAFPEVPSAAKVNKLTGDTRVIAVENMPVYQEGVKYEIGDFVKEVQMDFSESCGWEDRVLQPDEYELHWISSNDTQSPEDTGGFITGQKYFIYATLTDKFLQKNVMDSEYSQITTKVWVEKAKAEVTFVPKARTYDGAPHELSEFRYEVSFNGKTLEPGQYEVEFNDWNGDVFDKFDGAAPVNAGNYGVMITILDDALNNNYYVHDKNEAPIVFYNHVTIDPIQATLKVTPKTVTYDGYAHDPEDFIEKVEAVLPSGNSIELTNAGSNPQYSASFANSGSIMDWQKCKGETITVKTLSGNYSAQASFQPEMNPLQITFTLNRDYTADYSPNGIDAIVPQADDISWSTQDGVNYDPILDSTLDSLCNSIRLFNQSEILDAGTHPITYADLWNGKLTSGSFVHITNHNYAYSFNPNGHSLTVNPLQATLEICLDVNEDKLVYKKNDGYSVEELQPTVYIVDSHGNETILPESEYDDTGVVLESLETNTVKSETDDAGEYNLHTLLNADSRFAKNYYFGTNPVSADCSFTVKKQAVIDARGTFQGLTYDGKPHGIKDFWYVDQENPAYIVGAIDGIIEVDFDDFKFSPADENVTSITNVGEWFAFNFQLDGELAKNYEYTVGSINLSIDPLILNVKLTTRDLPYKHENYQPSDFVEKVELVDANGKVWETIPEGKYTAYSPTDHQNYFDAQENIRVGVTLDYSNQGGLTQAFPNYQIFHRTPEEAPYSCEAEAAITPLPITVSPKQGMWMYYNDDPSLYLSGGNLEFTTPDGTSERVRDFAASLLARAHFGIDIDYTPEPAGKYDYSMLYFEGKELAPGETVRIGSLLVTFEPKDRFEVKPFPVTITATCDVVQTYDGEITDIGYDVTWPDGLTAPDGMMVWLDACMALGNDDPATSTVGSYAIGKYDLICSVEGTHCPDGVETQVGDYAITFEDNGYRYIINNKVSGMKVHVDPVSNADSTISGSASGVKAPVDLVAIITSENHDDIVPIYGDSADFTATVDLPGEEHILPDGSSYYAGYRPGTSIELYATAPHLTYGEDFLVDAETGEPIIAETTVTDGLKLKIIPAEKKYDIGPGTAIVKPESKIIVRTNSEWEEYMYLTIGENEPILVNITKGQDFIIAADPAFVHAKQFKKGDALTEVLAELHSNSRATAALRVGVDTYDEPRKTETEGEAFPALITSPVAEGVGFVAGFAPAGSEVYVSVGSDKHYSSRSDGFRSFTRKVEGGREDVTLYFLIELKESLRKGENLFVKWVSPEGAVRRQTITIGDFDETARQAVTAEAFGQSILGGYTQDGKFIPGHHFILKVKTDELTEAMEVPIVAWGGYVVGSLKIEKVEGGLKVSYTIEAGKNGQDAKHLLLAYDAKPDYDRLHEDILSGESLSTDQLIQPKGDETWIYAAFEVENLHEEMLAHLQDYLLIDAASESLL